MGHLPLMPQQVEPREARHAVPEHRQGAVAAPVALESLAGAVRLAELSTRCRVIVELALEDEGRSVTAADADRRREALVPLDHAARRGLVAACAFPWDG